MKTKYFISTTILFLIIIWGCSDLQKELPDPTSPLTIHADNWNNINSENFHGKYLKAKKYNIDECNQCHGGNFEGGTSKSSCYTCHNSYPHKPGWLAKTNPNYHGLKLKSYNWDLNSCKSCHGNDFNGGTSGVGCFQCHNSYPHSSGWNQTTNAEFHGKYLHTKNWDLFSCQGCHGSSYDGGVVTNKSCMTAQCHVDANQIKKSPEACNTCHGMFKGVATVVKTWAPPRGILGDTSTTSRSVGAHQAHLVAGKLGKPLKCAECHQVPAQTFVNGHLDTNLPAEVAMKDTLARIVTGNGSIIPNPLYSFSEGSCSNTYCHGYFKNGNQSFKPNWTDLTGNQIKCGTCHGDVNKPTLAERALPRGTHIQSVAIPCSYCHYETVDANLNIINKAKHVNGKVDLKNPPKK